MSPLQGQLLIATPSLADPNFARAVVLVARHDDEGALGVILNRRTEHPAVEVVPSLQGLLAADEQLHIGGPVQPEGVLLLAEFAEAEADDERVTITGSIALVRQDMELLTLGENALRVRAFAGYAGWGPGQLEAEIERDDWFVSPALPSDAFAETPAALWRETLERMGGQYRLVALMPDDPSVN